MSGMQRSTIRLNCLNESGTGSVVIKTSNRKNSHHYRNENENTNTNTNTNANGNANANGNWKKLNKTRSEMIGGRPVGVGGAGGAGGARGAGGADGAGITDNIGMSNEKLMNKRKSMMTNNLEQTAIRRNGKNYNEVPKANNQMNAENNGQDTSPPKMKRKEIKLKKADSLTPSKLFDRLNINDNNGGDGDGKSLMAVSMPSTPASPTLRQARLARLGRPAAIAPSKYQNARKALTSCDVKNLPARDEQMDELIAFLRKHWITKTSGSLNVSGQAGTGKTASVTALLRCHEFCTSSIRKIYINCTGMNTNEAIYKKLCTELNLKPSGRHQIDYQTPIENYLKRVSKMIVIVMDEIDELCTTKQSVLYTIFEWVAMPRVHVVLIGIARSLDLTERVLKRLNTHYQMKPKHIHFPNYDKYEIIEIFNSRLAQADAVDVFPIAALQLLAGKVSAIGGDVRQALDIGKRVVDLAEQHNKSNNAQNDAPVNIGQVMEVLNKVYGTTQNLQYDLENDFPIQQKLLICTLILMLRNERNNKNICIGRLHEVYRRICSKRNIQSMDLSEFQNLINLVETRGILHVIRNKKSRLSKIELLWDEDEVNDILCDKQLVASILADTECLNK